MRVGENEEQLLLPLGSARHEVDAEPPPIPLEVPIARRRRRRKKGWRKYLDKVVAIGLPLLLLVLTTLLAAGVVKVVETGVPSPRANLQGREDLRRAFTPRRIDRQAMNMERFRTESRAGLERESAMQQFADASKEGGESLDSIMDWSMIREKSKEARQATHPAMRGPIPPEEWKNVDLP